jgi:hypothetical protein
MDQFVSKAIDQAAEILKKIDERWPAEILSGSEQRTKIHSFAILTMHLSYETLKALAGIEPAIA